MSTIVTENLKRSSETASRSLRGVAAAWVNFNGTGTVEIRDSQNVSSITDNNTGDYTVNATNIMADASYCSVASQGRGTSGSTNLLSVWPSAVDPTTSAIRGGTFNSSFSAVDSGHVHVANHGDLA